MSAHLLEVIDAGLGATFQDRGRAGWRRFGVPPSGAMDDHAAGWANVLLDNPPTAPVVELLLQGAKFLALHDCWIAVCGADAGASVLMWRAVRLSAGEEIRFSRIRSGVWTYLAVEGGFDAPLLLGSASVYARGRLGTPLVRGDVLLRVPGAPFRLPASVAGRSVAWEERRNYDATPLLRVWPGPQWDSFSEADRAAFLEQTWTVTPQSDRVGYRLSGRPLAPGQWQMVSEPLRVGTVQVPEDGQPIVMMRDGPTVGGYPKIGVVDAHDVARLAQSRPGRSVKFRLAAQTAV
ncbi:MAG: biotin-dependent carboxyltransferase family protein [Verrucomicrobiia bacterium]|jgi:biotin-dependent carboxylase-like uncharacterized protein